MTNQHREVAIRLGRNQLTVSTETILDAATRLHSYMLRKHWNGQALEGPDGGIRFNARFGRFIKSYLSFLPWADNYRYMQAQGYWIFANWLMRDLMADHRYQDLALACSDNVLAAQRPEGYWEYPNPEWAGRVATAEGTWGALGLLESYRQTGEEQFLAGALRWHSYVMEDIGFQPVGDQLAVNYFAHQPHGPRVPNNSAFLLRFLAELTGATGDEAYLQPAAGLIRFMTAAQLESGEFPYTVEGANGRKGRAHFQCFQYNAFQCLDLMRYHELTGDANASPLIQGVLGFLRGGLDPSGRAHYQCDNRHATVTYHTAVMAAAFARAHGLSIDGYQELAGRAYSHVLGRQRRDGGFDHSRGDYRFLSDRRSYPRYLSMILYHILSEDPPGDSGIAGKEKAVHRIR